MKINFRISEFGDGKRAIQAAFGWENSHLFEFGKHGLNDPDGIGIPNDEMPVKDARCVKLSAIFRKANDKFTYVYDFGDHWQHQVVLEEITDKEIYTAYRIGGKNECPPEMSATSVVIVKWSIHLPMAQHRKSGPPMAWSTNKRGLESGILQPTRGQQAHGVGRARGLDVLGREPSDGRRLPRPPFIPPLTPSYVIVNSCDIVAKADRAMAFRLSVMPTVSPQMETLRKKR